MSGPGGKDGVCGSKFTDKAQLGTEGAKVSCKSVGGNGLGGSGSMSLNCFGNCQFTLCVRRSDSGKESLSSHGNELKDSEFRGRSIAGCQKRRSGTQSSVLEHFNLSPTYPRYT